MAGANYPDLPLNQWRSTKTTLHLFTQIAGKIRLGLNPKLNHWWHVPLYVSARGLTTRAIPYENGIFEMEFDFLKHTLDIQTSNNTDSSIPLAGNSIADFYHKVINSLTQLGIDISILPKPFDPERTGSDIPFDRDTEHAEYDPDAVAKFWQILLIIEPIFREFRGRFLGKSSPVHFFWHSFDLAVIRFSGRPADLPAEADPVTKEAYSHEVSSAGFWVGDDNLPEPAFYSYAAPEPEGLAHEPLLPDSAFWFEQNGANMAIYKYADFKSEKNPREALLNFLQSSYDASAKRADWPNNLEMNQKQGRG